MDFIGDYAEFKRGRPKGAKDKKPRRSYGIKPAIAGGLVGAGIGLGEGAIMTGGSKGRRKLFKANEVLRRKGFQGKPARLGKKMHIASVANIRKLTVGANAAALGLYGYGLYRIVKHGNYKLDLARKERLATKRLSR